MRKQLWHISTGSSLGFKTDIMLAIFPYFFHLILLKCAIKNRFKYNVITQMCCKWFVFQYSFWWCGQFRWTHESKGSQFLNSEIKNSPLWPIVYLDFYFIFFKCMICIFQKQSCYIGKLSHCWCVQRVEIDSREPVMFSEFRLSLP